MARYHIENIQKKSKSEKKRKAGEMPARRTKTSIQKTQEHTRGHKMKNSPPN